MQIEPLAQPDLEHLVTPYFRHESIENVPQSELQGRPILEVREIVELRFAGDKNYAPVLPVDSMFRRDGHRVITYAERFQKQYQQFKDGESQTADGTPLDMLVALGMTPSQISMCRANNIHTIEALAGLSERGVRQLGNSANFLREISGQYLAERHDLVSTSAEVSRLRAELEAMKAANIVPPVEASQEQKDATIELANAEFEQMSDDSLKEWIADKTGNGKPRGNISRETLLSMVRELS